MFQPKQHDKSGHVIVCTTTHNPSHIFNSRVISNLLTDIYGENMKKAFTNCKVVMGTRQPKSLRNFLIRSKFSSQPKRIEKKSCGLFNCRSCIYHNRGYIQECTFFRFGKYKQFIWKYNRRFDCDSKNVIYVLICNHCWEFYIGETQDLKERIHKHKSDVYHTLNSNCKKLSTHLRRCSNLREPFFNIYPIYFVEGQQRRRFIEKRFIYYYKPPLNSDS